VSARRGEQVFISALGVAQICSWGSLYYAFPLIAAEIEIETGWSRMSLYGAATCGLLLAAIAAVPVGRAIDRGHGRLIMTGASILAGLLLLAWTQVSDLVGFYAIVALLGALQAATLYEPAFAVIARRYGAGQARGPITTLTLWGGFASTVFIPLVQVGIEAWGWRGAAVMLAGINVFVCAAIHVAVIRPERDAQPEQQAARAANGQSHLANAMASPVFWLIALSFTAHAAVFSAFTFHFYPLLMEQQFSIASIMLAMMLIGPAQVAGRIAVMWLGRKAPIRRIGAVAVAGFPLAFVLLIAVPGSLGVIVAVTLVYSAANGILTIVRGAAIPEMLSRQSYGAIAGAITAPATIARALAPLGAAALWTVTLSYEAALFAMLAGSLVIAVAFWWAAAISARRAAV
jgi:predicted MFS family arabinose efflux permease